MIGTAEKHIKEGKYMNINTTTNITKRLTDGEIDTGISKMGDSLSGYKKYTVALPLIEGEAQTVEVCYNGYVIRIKRGVSVELPEPIYMLLLHSGKLATR